MIDFDFNISFGWDKWAKHLIFLILWQFGRPLSFRIKRGHKTIKVFDWKKEGYEPFV